MLTHLPVSTSLYRALVTCFPPDVSSRLSLSRLRSLHLRVKMHRLCSRNANSFVIGTAVINTHNTHTPLHILLLHTQAVDYLEALGCDAHKEEFCHCRGVFFHINHCTLGMACAQAVAMRSAPTAACRLVAAPQNQQPPRSDPREFDRHFSHPDDVP